MQLFALLSFLGGASALIASPLAAHATQQRVAVSPMMACNGGKGGRGGEGERERRETLGFGSGIGVPKVAR